MSPESEKVVTVIYHCPICGATSHYKDALKHDPRCPRKEVERYLPEAETVGREVAEGLAYNIAERGSQVPGGTGHPYNTGNEHRIYKLALHLRAGGETVEEATDKLAAYILEWALHTYRQSVPEREETPDGK